MFEVRVRTLLVNPEFPDSYWSGKYALPFVRRRSLLPPLGLITVAALLPKAWNCRLVDLNGESLSDADLRWADVVMLTGMIVQHVSLHQTLARCQRIGVRTVVGGPYATALPQKLDSADHVVIGEAEQLVHALSLDLAGGRGHHLYREKDKPDLTRAPVPRFDLLKPDFYQQMALQFSRGCPFDCEFCDIIVMYGRKVRTKKADQVIAELEAIRATGFSGDVFFVDDNFVGSKKAVKEMLPKIAVWRRRTRPPLEFYTQASIDMADDTPLVDLMTQAGFTKVFIGIETPSLEALKETGKVQNLNRNMLEQVHWLLEQGLDVSGGFILGFDNDGLDIFERLTVFVQQAAIPYAMVGLLGALPNTRLYHRLEQEGRLRPILCGDQFGMTNVIPRMPANQLLSGYRRVLEELYKPEKYFQRCQENLARWKPVPGSSRPLQWQDVPTALRFLWAQGFAGSYRRAYWRFLGWVFRNHPSKMSRAIRQAAAGHHFINYTRNVVIPSLARKEKADKKDHSTEPGKEKGVFWFFPENGEKESNQRNPRQPPEVVSRKGQSKQNPG